MSNIFVKIAVALGRDLEVAAEDVLHFEATQVQTAIKATPGVLAALAVVAGGVLKAGQDVTLDATNPAAIVLGGVQQLQDFIALGPDIKDFLKSIGVTKI